MDFKWSGDKQGITNQCKTQTHTAEIKDKDKHNKNIKARLNTRKTNIPPFSVDDNHNDTNYGQQYTNSCCYTNGY